MEIVIFNITLINSLGTGKWAILHTLFHLCLTKSSKVGTIYYYTTLQMRKLKAHRS